MGTHKASIRGDVAPEQQTTRTAPEDFDGYSAAPAGQRVVDVKTSAGAGSGPQSGHRRRSARRQFENAFGATAPGSHRVDASRWSSSLVAWSSPRSPHSGTPAGCRPAPGAPRRKDGDAEARARPAHQPFASGLIVGISAVWPAASATAPLRRQLQHPIVAVEGDVEVAGGVHRHI